MWDGILLKYLPLRPLQILTIDFFLNSEFSIRQQKECDSLYVIDLYSPTNKATDSISAVQEEIAAI